ncbi:hypothetical protein [Streptomyces sp. CB01881]|nr:hypothetical protein [Streptomyces sp. CB01881]
MAGLLVVPLGVTSRWGGDAASSLPVNVDIDAFVMAATTEAALKLF